MIKILKSADNQAYLEISPEYQDSKIYGIHVIPEDPNEEIKNWTLAKSNVDNLWHFFFANGMETGTLINDVQLEEFRKTTVLTEAFHLPPTE